MSLIFIRMRRKYVESVEIPKGIDCEFSNDILKCKREDLEVERKMSILGTEINIKNNKITLMCERANKKIIAMIKTAVSHIKNMLNGLDNKFVYKLEICHVHFPMTVKVEKEEVVINNFLGEKKPRTVDIIHGANVEVKGNEIIVTSHDIEKAGQTAANIEKITKVSKKDRRIFQDGIFITEKPGGKI